MLKREWDAESNGKLQHQFIPSKTATLVPEFAVIMMMILVKMFQEAHSLQKC